jgi:hypothetical protein
VVRFLYLFKSGVANKRTMGKFLDAAEIVLGRGGGSPENRFNWPLFKDVFNIPEPSGRPSNSASAKLDAKNLPLLR